MSYTREDHLRECLEELEELFESDIKIKLKRKVKT